MKKSELKTFFETHLKNFNSIESNDLFPKNFYEQFLSGENTVYHKNIKEIKIFDEEWIDTVESYFPSINKIIANPKSGLRYEEEVVLVEKAKKINSQTVKHLASHSEHIKEINEKGMIVPKKLLTTYSEIEYATYENRVVMTLIERLFFFVRKRYETIKDNVQSFQRTKLILNTNFPVNNADVSIDLDVTIKEDLEDKSINEHNKKLLKRVEHLNKLVTSFYNSQFMQDLKGALKVRAPIMKTSIILKNVDYQNVYLLWLFLDRYNTLAFNLEVDEKSLELDDKYLENINQLALMNFSTVAYNEKKNSLEYNEIPDNKYIKKGIRQVAVHANDLLEDPNHLVMENNVYNEYYLNQLKELFTDRIQSHSEDVKLADTALKRSMRELQNITNNIYQSHFEFDVDPDIFRRLIRRGNPIEQINDVKDKLHFAKLIREVKEVDYNEQIRLERRLIKKVLELDSILIEASHKERVLTAKSIEKAMLSDNKKKEILKQDEHLKLYFEKVKANREALDIEKKEALEKISNLQKELKAEEEKYYKEIQDKLNKSLDIQIQKLSKDHETQMKRLKDRFIKEQIVQDEQLKQRIDNLTSDHEASLVKINNDLNKTYSDSVKDYQKLLEKKFLEAKILTEQEAIKNEFKHEEIIKKLHLNKGRN